MAVYETIRRIDETQAMVEDGLETVIKRTIIGPGIKRSSFTQQYIIYNI